MKKKMMSWLLTIVMLLGMLPVMELPASAASSTPTIVKSKLTTDMELQDNTIYVVNESYTIGGEIDKNGLRVKENAETVIYIAKDVTLTVKGGGSVYNTKGGKAGILLPASSTLTITGQGTLIVYGGDGCAASNGGDGMPGKGLAAGNDFGDLSSVTFWGGAGGSGGNGGSGGGAAIGTDGGAGGAGGSGALGGSAANTEVGSQAWVCGNTNKTGNTIVDFIRNPSAGGNGSDGTGSSKMGKLFIVGDVTVQAEGGDGGAKGQAGKVPNIRNGAEYSYQGKVKDSDKRSKQVAGALIRFDLGTKQNYGYSTFCLGPGGAGGGGGGGGNGANIGTGGTGGGGGGGGGNGGLDGTDSSERRHEANEAISETKWNTTWEVGSYGKGGKGAVNGDGETGSGGTGAFGLYNEKYNDFKWRHYNDTQSTGGNGGANGTEVNRNSTTCRVTTTAQVNNTFGQAGPESVQPPVAYHTFALDKTDGTGGSPTADIVFGTTETTQLSVPSRTGYNFQGYYTAASGGIQLYSSDGKPTSKLTPSTDTSLLNDSTLYAQWRAITYTVNFYNADGSALLDTVQATYGRDFTFYDHAGKTVPDGKTFKGWSKWPYASNAIYDAGAKARNLTTTQGEVLNFYAVYQDIPDLTITYNANGGSGAPASDSVPYGGAYTIPSEVPTRDGYTFQCWQNSGVSFLPMQPGDKITNLHISLNLYAVWKHNPSVTYNANGGYFTTSLPVDYPSPAGTYTLTSVVPVREGYVFAGWECNGKTYQSRDTYNLNKSYDDITFTAVWEKAQYTLMLEGDPNVVLAFSEPTTVTSGNKYAYKTDFTFTATGDGTGTVRVYVNGVLLSPQDDGKYHFTMTGDTKVKTTLTAKVPEYVVSYDPNGGHDAPNDNKSYQQGSTVIVKGQDSMFRTGYTFTGWSDGTEIYQPDGSYTMGSSDVTFTAQWTANSYSIVYDANGGAGNMADSTMKYDVGGEISQNGFTKTGYRFTGWALDPNGLPYYLGGEAVRNLTAESDGKITLYAIWTPEEYTVTLDAMDGTPAKSYVKATYDAEMPKITLPTRTGYIFGGYYDAMVEGTGYYDDTGASMRNWDKDKNAMLYACWSPIRYSVSYDLNGGEGGMFSVADYAYGDSWSIPKAGDTISRNGYRFAGWSLSKNGSVVYVDGATVKNLASEQGATVTLYAVWEPIPTYTVHYDANGGSGGPENSDPVTEGEDYVIPDAVPTRDGYKFLGWSENPAATQPNATYAAGKTLTMTQNLTLYAVWQKLGTYTITYKSGVSDSSVSNLPPAGKKTEGEPYILSSITPVREGYNFAGWSKNYCGEKDYEAEAVYNEDKDLALYAIWKAKSYRLYVYNSGAGTLGVTCNGQVLSANDVIKYGDELTITAEPLTGYTTASFSLEVNGLPVTNEQNGVVTTNMTVEGDVTVALLDHRGSGGEVRYTVKYNANGGTGSIDDQTVNSTETTQLSNGTGFTKEHAKLIGWATAANGGVAYALGETLTAPIAADDQTVTLYAVWQAENTYTVTYDANGGIGGPKDENAYYEDDKVSVLFTDKPTRSGWTFLGWSTDRSATVATYDEDGISEFTMTTENVMLYAVWQRSSYSVTVDGDDVAEVTFITPEDANGKYQGGTTVKFTVAAKGANVLNSLTVAVNGSVLLMTEENGVLAGSFVIDRDSTITVRSGATTYTVTYDKNGGDSPAVNETMTYVTGQALTLHSGAGYTKDGCHIAGWDTASDGNGTRYKLGQVLTNDLSASRLYAVWEQDADPKGYHYKIKYVANGGEGEDFEQDMYENVLSTSLYNGDYFHKDHATLIGWATAPNGGVVYALNHHLTTPLGKAGEIVTLYAVWKADDTYTVRYDPNGGTGEVPNDVNLYYKDASVTVKFDPAPTREGYQFLGWAGEPDARTPSYMGSESNHFEMGAENVTLYAVWQQNLGTYTVTYDANGGTGEVPTDYSAYAAGAVVKVQFTPEPSRDDCSFLGWAETQTAADPKYTSSKPSFTMSRANVTLYAVWHQIQHYTITYYPNADGVTGMPGNGGKTEDVNYTISSMQPHRDGYTFKGWSKTANGTVDFSGGESYTTNANLELYAVWERMSYEITSDNGNVSTVMITTQADANGKYSGDTTIAFTVAPDDPYTLDDLTVTVNGAVVQMAKDTAGNKLTGSFVIECDSAIAVRVNAQTYTVSYDPNGGNAPAAAETKTYVVGVDMALHSGTGFTKADHHITGWNTQADGNGTGYRLAESVTDGFGSNTTLYAVWEPDSTDPRGYHYTIQYNANGGTGANTTQDMYQNVSAQLYTAAQAGFSRSGYDLIGWSATPSGGKDYSLGATVSSPLASSAEQTVTLYAVWQARETYVTVTLSDPQNVNTTPSITVRYGGLYGRLPVLSKDNYTFDGWYNESGRKVESTTRVTNSSPHTLYARWTKITSGGNTGGGGGGRPSRPTQIIVTGGYNTAYKTCPRDKTCPAYRFKDLNLKLWYHDGIHFCMENGLMQGISDGLFTPDGVATRAQIVMILWRIEKNPYLGQAGFSDVNANDWFAGAVNWASANGIVTGYTDGRFGPNDHVTREQLAAILYRYARYKGYDVSVGEDTNILSYEDALTVSDWAVSAMQWACGSGVINGTSESTLSPKDTATRAQIAAMIMRFLVDRIK